MTFNEPKPHEITLLESEGASKSRRSPAARWRILGIILTAVTLAVVFRVIAAGPNWFDTAQIIGISLSYVIFGALLGFAFRVLLVIFGVNPGREIPQQSIWLVFTVLLGIWDIWVAWKMVYPSESMAYVYRPAGCEFSVRFPAEPRSFVLGRPVHPDGGQDIPNNASLDTSLSGLETRHLPFTVLTAGCIEWDNSEFKSDGDFPHALLNSDAMLNDLETSRIVEDGVIVYAVKGIYDHEDSDDVAGEYRWYVGNRSLLTLRTMGLERNMPSKMITDFYESVTRLDSGQQ